MVVYAIGHYVGQIATQTSEYYFCCGFYEQEDSNAWKQH